MSARLFLSSVLLESADHLRSFKRIALERGKRAVWQTDEFLSVVVIRLRDRGADLRGCGCTSTCAARCGRGDDDPCGCACHGGAS